MILRSTGVCTPMVLWSVLIAPQVAWAEPTISKSVISPAMLKSTTLASTLLTPPLPAHSADTSEVLLSLQQAQMWAQQSQTLQSFWQQRQAVAQANVTQSLVWQNPELSIGQTGFHRNTELEFSVSISQKLDVFGERAAREQLARIQLQQSDLAQLSDTAQLQLAVTAEYWQLAQAEWVLQLGNHQAQLSQQALNVAQKRLDAGRIAALDYDKILIAHQQQQRDLQRMNSDQQIAHDQLAQFWEAVQPFSGTGQPLQFPILDQSLSKIDDNNDLFQQQLRQQQQLAQAELSLAKIRTKPQPTVSLGYVERREAVLQSDQKTQRIMLGVSIPLPLFNRHQGVVQAQQALQQMSMSQRELELRLRQQRMQQTWRTLQALQQQYQILTTQQMPLAEQIQQKTLTGFEVGKLSVLDVQQAMRDYQQLQAEQLQILAQAWQGMLTLQAIRLGVSNPESLITPNSRYALNNQILQSGKALVLPVTGE